MRSERVLRAGAPGVFWLALLLVFALFAPPATALSVADAPSLANALRRADDDAPPAALATAAEPTVLAGLAGLEWSDLGPTRTPNLWRLLAVSDVASISVRTLTPTCPRDAWLSISAGSRVALAPSYELAALGQRCAPLPVIVRPAAPELDVNDVEVTETSFADGLPAAGGATGAGPTGGEPTGDGAAVPDTLAVPAQVRDWAGLVDPGGAVVGSLGQPGVLGDALAAQQTCATAVGPGAALALATSDGEVSGYRPTLPSDAAELAELVTRCPLTVVDLGELPDMAADRSDALAAVDQQVGRLAAAVPQAGRFLIAGVADTPYGPHDLQVALERRSPALGPPSWLTSASARREGVITVNDLSATIASDLGIATAEFDGARVEAGVERRLSARGTVDNRRYLATLTTLAFPVNAAIWGVLVLASAIGIATLWRRSAIRPRRTALAALTVAALLPAASALATVSSWWSRLTPGPVLVASVIGFAALLALLAWGVEQVLGRRLVVNRAWLRPGAIAAITWLVLTVDGLLGTPLQFGSPMGPSLADGARYYGFGNMVFAVYAVSGLVVAAAVLAIGRRAILGQAESGPPRRAAVVIATAIALITVAVDALPMFGADAGGIPALVPAFVLLLLLANGNRLRWRHWLWAALVTVGAVVLIAAIAWALPAGSHLGQFVQRVLAGDAWNLVLGKAVGAWRTIANPFGAAAAVLTVAVFAFVLRPGFRKFGSLGSAPNLGSVRTGERRYADGRLQANEQAAISARLSSIYRLEPVLWALVVALVTVAVVGSVMNDSGVAIAAVVTALGAAILATGGWADGIAQPEWVGAEPESAPSAAPGLTIPAGGTTPTSAALAVPDYGPAAPLVSSAESAPLREPFAILASAGAMALVLGLVIGLAPVGPPVAGAQTRSSTTVAQPQVGASARKLVVLGTSGLRWPDLATEQTELPVLSQFLYSGADIGGLSLATGRAARCLGSGWLTLSAGQLAEIATPRPGGGFDCPTFQVTPTPAGGAVVNHWSQLLNAQVGSPYGARLGSLGAAFESGGTGAAAQTQAPNAVAADLSGVEDVLSGAENDVKNVAAVTGDRCATAVGPGAAVALADPSGAVARYRTVAQAVNPTAAPDVFACPVTLIDVASGTYRLDSADSVDARLAQDALTGAILAHVPAEATVLIADLDQRPGAAPALGLVMVQAGEGSTDRPRLLTSSATRTEGVARLQDLPATMLQAAGLNPSAPLDSSSLIRSSVRPADPVSGAADLARVTSRDQTRRANYTAFVDGPFWAGLILAAVCLGYGIIARRRRLWVGARAGGIREEFPPTATTDPLAPTPDWLAEPANRTLATANLPADWPDRLLNVGRWAAVIIAAFSAASFLNGLAIWWRLPAPTSALWLVTALITLLVAALTALGSHRVPWTQVGVVAGITWAVLTLDAFGGTTLNRASVLGSAPTFGARFFGFGNPTFSIYAVTSLFFAAAVGQHILATDSTRRESVLRSGPTGSELVDPPGADLELVAPAVPDVRRRRLAAAVVVAIGLVTTVVNVWPTLGADFGGGLVLLPAFVIIALSALGSRLTFGRFALWAGVGVLAVAAISIADWLRPIEQRSHLGGFVQQFVDGSAWDTVWRKAAAALGTLSDGPLIWLSVAILVIAAIALFGPARLAARWTPPSVRAAYERWSLLRPCLQAIWVICVAGSLVNDFGLRIAMIALIPAVPLTVLAVLAAAGARQARN